METTLSSPGGAFARLVILLGVIGAAAPAARADSEHERAATAWLTAGYERKASGDLGETAAARAEFAVASRGTDADLARRADQELAGLPSPWWADLYAESFGWS